MKDSDKEGQPKKSRIPQFASVEEEAQFWDTHDTAEFEEEFRPVKVRFTKNLTEGITVQLDPETLSKLRALAKEQGVRPTTLVRMWILERMKENEGRRLAS